METDATQANAGKRRGVGKIMLGLLLIAVGMAVSVGGMVYIILDSFSNVQRHAFPGTATLTLDAATYTISHEHRSIIDGRTFNTPRQLPPMQCSLRRSDDGSDVPLQPSRAKSTYTTGSYEGESLFTVNIDTPGEYILEASYANADGPEFVLAVQQGTFFGRFGIIMLVGFGGGIIALGGVALCIIGVVQLVTTR